MCARIHLNHPQPHWPSPPLRQLRLCNRHPGVPTPQFQCPQFPFLRVKRPTDVLGAEVNANVHERLTTPKAQLEVNIFPQGPSWSSQRLRGGHYSHHPHVLGTETKGRELLRKLLLVTEPMSPPGPKSLDTKHNCSHLSL